MALNGEREKYFGGLLQREASEVEALCQAPGAGSADCGGAPEVSICLAPRMSAVATLLAYELCAHTCLSMFTTSSARKAAVPMCN